MSKTPYGEACINREGLSEIYINLINLQARGSWQKRVVGNLLDDGYIVDYLATGGPLRGNARKWSTKYGKSLQNLMARIEEALDGGYIILESGPTGKKGGYGHYIAKRR